MMIKNKEPKRPFLVIKAWDANMLRERERAEMLVRGFGKGYVRAKAKVEEQPQVHPSQDDLNRKDLGEEEGSLLVIMTVLHSSKIMLYFSIDYASVLDVCVSVFP